MTKTPFGWDYSGASHMEELRAIMSMFMIRRMKSVVMTQLPPKVREKVLIAANPVSLPPKTPIATFFSDGESPRIFLFGMD
jgi:hypothetical protein